MDRSRRGLLKMLYAFAALFGFLGLKEARAEMSNSELTKRRDRAKLLQEQEGKEIDRLYSTKPIRVLLGKREYRIPANYFGPKQLEEPDTFRAERYFGYFLFFPDYEGYTKENWRDPFDTRRIQVTDVSLVDKDAVIPISGGGSQKIQPAGYGDPVAQFRNRQRGLEEMPSFKLYGLEGYRGKGTGAHGTRTVTWTGTRSNGEFFFFESSIAPREAREHG